MQPTQPTILDAQHSNAARYEFMRQAYARNVAGLARMLATAEQTGKKVGGYTADQLRESVAEYTRLSQLDDAAMLEHLQQTHTRIRQTTMDTAAKMQHARVLAAIAARLPNVAYSHARNLAHTARVQQPELCAS